MRSWQLPREREVCELRHRLLHCLVRARTSFTAAAATGSTIHQPAVHSQHRRQPRLTPSAFSGREPVRVRRHSGRAAAACQAPRHRVQLLRPGRRRAGGRRRTRRSASRRARSCGRQRRRRQGCGLGLLLLPDRRRPGCDRCRDVQLLGRTGRGHSRCVRRCCLHVLFVLAIVTHGPCWGLPTDRGTHRRFAQ